MVMLSDGRTLKADFRKITIREYRAMFEPGRPQEYEDEIVARVYGLTVEELLGMNYVDYHAIGRDFFEHVQKPLENPN